MHRLAFRRPIGVTARYAANPVSGEFCYTCGVKGHHKENCPIMQTLKDTPCPTCRRMGHTIRACFIENPELDFTLWEDGLAFPGDLLKGSDEYEVEKENRARRRSYQPRRRK